MGHLSAAFLSYKQFVLYEAKTYIRMYNLLWRSHTDRGLGKLVKDLLLYMSKEPHWLWKGLRGEITLCEGMLGPTKYTGDGGIMTG